MITSTTLDDVDFTRPATFSPIVETQVQEQAIVDLAHHLNDPNLLKCDSPLPNEDDLTLVGVDACVFWCWLNSSPHRAVVEVDLQSLSETDKGEKLYTTWLEWPEFLALVRAAAAVGVLPDLRRTISGWQAAGAARVYLDGYAKT